MSDSDFDDSGGDDLSASGASLSNSQSSLGQSGGGWNNDDDEMFGGEDEKKADVGYEILTAAQVMEKPLEMISEVNELFQIDPGVARQLLQHANWNSEKLVTRYFAGEKDKLFKEARIPLELGSYKKPTGEISCSVCFDSFDSEEIFGLTCNHFFCRECYADYLVVKVNTEGQAAEIRCPARDCFLQVDEITALKLLPQGNVRDRYLTLIAKAFVRDNKFLRSCPAPGCGNFAKLALATKTIIVRCTCGDEYCSGCNQTSHRPCNCQMMEQWRNKMQSDSESENWLKLYTRACPKCKAMISKDGGCQYMRCQTCSTAFCWLCMGLFDHKNHDCNRLELGPNATEAAKSLAKWEHFSKRYASHAQAIHLQAKLLSRAQNLITVLENDFHRTYIELVFILEATKTILSARKVLKDTYVYGYFLPESVNRALFEHLQGQLEAKTEELSGLIEKKPEEVWRERLKIIDIEKTLKQSLQNVITGLEKGDVKGNVEIKSEWEDKPVKVEYDGWVYNAN